jgi:hypothetical protein
MSNKVIDPSFVKCFKDRDRAIKAVTVLVTAKEEGNYSNKQVLNLPFFKVLFSEEYLSSVSSEQLEWRLKNIARDLKNLPFSSLAPEWHDLKKFFEGTRRKIKTI